MILKNIPYKKILFFTFIALIIFFTARYIKIEGHIGVVRNWIESLGFYGLIVYLFILIFSFVLALPSSFLIAMAGALFGSLKGIIIVSIGATIGAVLCFIISRYLAREKIKKWIGTKPAFQKIDQQIQKNGAIVIAVTRLSMIFPYAVLNYGFGLTNVSFLTYVFWSWLCLLPEIIILVVGVDTILTFIRSGEVSWVMIGIVLIMLALIATLAKVAHKKLKM